MEPRTANIVWTTVGIILLLIFACCHVSCSQPAPARVAVPTAAQVRARIGLPAAAAKVSNARAVQLAAKAEKTGLAAGSADAHALNLATAETDRHLIEVLAGKDDLTAQLGQTQLQIDALEKDDAAKTRLVLIEKETAEKDEAAYHRWRRWCILGLLAVDVLISIAGAALQTAFRAVEKFVGKEAVAAAEGIAHLLMKIPAVAGTVLKIAAVVAAFV